MGNHHIYWNNLLSIFENYYGNQIFTILAFLYLPMIYILQRYMKNREKYDIKNTVFTWNIIMCFFSTVGTVITLPTLYKHIVGKNSLCDTSVYGNKEYNLTQLTIFIYCTTKIFECVDTVILILKKKKIIFLHWFHHIVTMLFCWHSIYF